ncbi:two component transcriptional regulator, LuxR family [Roseomonas rosea]|uniref:Two component transcriptional regulator, LuxR family n=1 Tax=Muricoccus roseus TaxID=198092 RepID=A0A1M6RE63_9PROT|nr:response regulator [Roseomonas rosea]SHK30742.1 two component transcriptional regulator, LuxR family [Roseomonas rosea]
MTTGPGARSVVHVIDDDEDVLWSVATLLTSYELEVETHPSAVAFLAALPGLAEPGCVLTDVRMPDMDGMELLRRLREGVFRRPVIVMTAHGDVSMAVRAMKDGAFDFIEKPFSDEALFAIVKAALALPPHEEAPAGELPAEGTLRPEVSRAVALIATLSPREREVLDLAMEGKPSKIIAHELGISPRTVEVHRLRLMARLGVGSLAEAVRLSVWADMAGPRPAPEGSGEAGPEEPA